MCGISTPAKRGMALRRPGGNKSLDGQQGRKVEIIERCEEKTVLRTAPEVSLTETTCRTGARSVYLHKNDSDY